MFTPLGCADDFELESFKGLTLDASREVEHFYALQRPRKSTKRKPPQRASISALPPELLQEILEWGFLLSDTTTAPFEVIVSHVSSYWRDVALSTSLLWSTLDISLQSSVDFIETYLQRSKTKLLDLRFDFFWRLLGPSTSVEEICDLVIAHSGRWGAFFVEGDIGPAVTTMINRIRALATPQLTQLSIFIESDHTNPDTQKIDFVPQIFTRAAPLLKIVRLGGVALRQCRPPLDSVTILDLKEISRSTRITYQRFREMVTGCPALAKLVIQQQVIERDSWPEESSTSPPRIALPSLRFLHFQGYPDSVSKVLSAISAPHLESLSLGDIHRDAIYDYFKSQQCKLASRNFPHLDTLSLEELTWGDTEYQILCAIFPTITHLELTCRITRFMKFLGQTAIPLPDLDTITIRHVNYNDDQPEESHECIYDLLSDRISLGRPIKRLILDVAEEATTDRIEWLRERVQLEFLDEE